MEPPKRFFWRIREKRAVLLFNRGTCHGRVRIGKDCWFLPHVSHIFRTSEGVRKVSFQLSLNTESVAAAYPDEPLFVAPDASLGEVLQLLRAQRTGSVLIDSPDGEATPQGNLLGILMERDALKCMAANADMSQCISEVMTEEPARLPSDTTVGDTVELMSDGGYRQLPIMDELVPIMDQLGTPRGMATADGTVHYLVDHFPQAIYNLPPQAKSWDEGS